MYTLVSGYGTASALGSGWKEISNAVLNPIAMNQLFNLYRKLYLTISTPALADPIHVDLDIFRVEYINSTQTLSAMLNNLSNNALDTLDEIPQYSSERVQYEDAFRAGYKIEVTAPYSHPSSLVYPSDRTEVKINRPNTDMQMFYDYCMISINGFWHCSDTDGQSVFALGGGKSLLKSRQNNIGFTSFEKIGKLQHIPITEDILYKLDNSDKYSNRVYFDLSAYDTENKTVMLVIGGYLYLPEPAYIRQYSDNTYMLDFTGVPLFERYFESMRYLDMSSLGLSEYINNPTQTHRAQFYEDACFTKYLTHENSFVVIVDTPQIYTSKHFIRHNNYPGMFTTYTEPKYPLITGLGRVAEYWKAYEDGHWSVNVTDAWLNHRQFSTLNGHYVISGTDANTPYQTYYPSKGYFLEIGSDVLATP